MHNEPIRIELPTLFGMKTVNAWLFLEPEPVLIDCGEKTDAAWDALNLALKKNGITIKDIKKIIITHAHLDHMGLANKITKHSDADIYLNEYALDWALDLERMMQRRNKAFGSAIFKNMPKELAEFAISQQKFNFSDVSPHWERIEDTSRVKVFPMQGTIHFGGEDWQILYTPGHCINQTCFYNPKNGFLMSADMLLNLTSTPILDAAIEPPYEVVKSLKMQMQSYDLLKTLNITKVFPGHYDSFDNALEMIEDQVNRINFRKNHCYELIKDGHQTLPELLPLIYPNRVSPLTFCMVIGFLDILTDSGAINAEMKNGYRHYFNGQLTMDNGQRI
jgi:glyoxylase-like metal-dependent hydrolase (beta-lactamase superfamily II)